MKNKYSRDVAVSLYRRCKELERAISKRLRDTILVPYFGGCGCRMHNCVVSYEWGQKEDSVNGLNHKELVKIAKRYYREQRQMWDKINALEDHFAKSF